jgi:hypothetical protein
MNKPFQNIKSLAQAAAADHSRRAPSASQRVLATKARQVGKQINKVSRKNY